MHILFVILWSFETVTCFGPSITELKDTALAVTVCFVAMKMKYDWLVPRGKSKPFLRETRDISSLQNQPNISRLDKLYFCCESIVNLKLNRINSG